VESQSIRLPQSNQEDADSVTDVKLGGLLRLQFGRSDVRFAITLDGELSPTRLRRPIHADADLPRLPTASFALAFGVAWHAH
jgi:hypothetical protein